MWKFKSADDSDGNPLLHSLNGNIGRQTWVFDAQAGSKADRDNIESLREAFTKSRHSQKHSSDELLRYAVGTGRSTLGREALIFSRMTCVCLR
jgi:cycloartenol synthase